MPKGVRMDTFLYTRFSGKARQQVSDVALLEHASPQGRKHRCPRRDRESGSVTNPASEEFHRSSVYTHYPSFVPLAVLHRNQAFVEVNFPLPADAALLFPPVR
jgi:hypothetical protein